MLDVSRGGGASAPPRFLLGCGKAGMVDGDRFAAYDVIAGDGTATFSIMGPQPLDIFVGIDLD
jgi:hypothetical protein